MMAEVAQEKSKKSSKSGALNNDYCYSCLFGCIFNVRSSGLKLHGFICQGRLTFTQENDKIFRKLCKGSASHIVKKNKDIFSSKPPKSVFCRDGMKPVKLVQVYSGLTI